MASWVQVTAAGPSGHPGASVVLSRRVADRLHETQTQTFVAVASMRPLGLDAFTADIPGLPDGALDHLDADGMPCLGTEVKAGDILVGCARPLGERRLSIEERMVRSVFGEFAASVADGSLRVPHGVAGRVTAVASLPPEAGEVARAAVTITWASPVRVGDVIVDRRGRRGTVVAIADLAADLLWTPAQGAHLDIRRAACAQAVAWARGTGPVDPSDRLPATGKPRQGGQPIHPGMVRALLAQGAGATVAELLHGKADDSEMRRALASGEGLGAAPWRLPPGARGVCHLAMAAGLRMSIDPAGATLAVASDADRLAASYGEVRGTGLVNPRTRRPEVRGPFCARIFGPTEDQRCLCGKYDDAADLGVVCEKCGVEVGSATLRWDRPGHLVLPVPIVHPWFVSRVAAALGIDRDALDRVCHGTSGLRDGREVDEDFTWEETGGQGIVAALESIEAPQTGILSVFAVPPPCLRPSPHGLSRAYARLVGRCARLTQILARRAPTVICLAELEALVGQIEVLFGPRSPGLGSRIRLWTQQFQAKRVDFSAVGLVVPAPSLPAGTCRLPRDLAHTLGADGPDALVWVVPDRADSEVVASARGVVGDGVAIGLSEDLWDRLGIAFAGDRVQVHRPCSPAATAEAREGLFRTRLPPAVDRIPGGWFVALIDGADPQETLTSAAWNGTASGLVDPWVRALLALPPRLEAFDHDGIL